MNNEHLNHLLDTQSLPIKWTFIEADYSKLSQGHRSNWIILLQDGVVHFYHAGGDEFYKFSLTLQDDKTYLAETLEAYSFDDFMETMRSNGASDSELRDKRSTLVDTILEEVAGLLQVHFNITVPAKLH